MHRFNKSIMNSSAFYRALLFLLGVLTFQHTSLYSLSQTEAFLSVVPTGCINDRLIGYFGAVVVEDHMKLLDQLQAEEKQHPNHWAVYHGGSSFMCCFYDLYKEISVLLGRPCLPIAFRKNSDLADLYIPEYLAKYHYTINDNTPPNKTELLSVNLSALGHLRSHESAFYYFKKNHSWEVPSGLLQSFLNEFDLRLSQYNALLAYIDLEMKRIGALFDAEEGYLAQIFIPHDCVDKFLYLSRPAGRMWTHKIIYSNEKSHDEGYDPRYGYTSINPLLTVYVEHPELLGNSIHKMQARLLLHKDFLNPESGIIMKRYMLCSTNAYMSYEQELKKLAQYIVGLINSPTIEPKSLQITLENRMQKNDWPVHWYTLNCLKESVSQEHAAAALQQAWTGLGNMQASVKLAALDLFRALISHNLCEPQEVLRAIRQGLCDENVYVQDKAFKLMRFMAQKNYCISEIMEQAKQRIQNNCWYTRLYGLKLYYDILKNNYVPHLIPEIYAAAMAACNDIDSEIRFFAHDLFKLFFEQEYAVDQEEILKQVSRLTNDTDSRVRRIATETEQWIHKRVHT